MRRHTFSSIAITLMLGWSATGWASDAITVFGITLHQPLQTTECLKRQDDYLSDDHEQCYKWPAGVTPSDTLPKDGQMIVNVPVEDRPMYMSGSDVVVGLKNGVVVSVSAKTHGTAGGGDDMHYLKAQFGKPKDGPMLSNVLPNTFTAVSAYWSLSDDTQVYYNSGEWGPYYGLVRVQTPDASQHQQGVWD
ncbi:hypothetical protein [Dyella mobilis]|uniref:Uncharacterized protein n=1 Tax=Dyella mobilis TaxID=1849582 RepID=A0ABS2KJM4_9GAMM|nr:hypothetical protein [Dyella mobilis]MBM7131279.1 hypothetical protein [Dyella mobilis]GLQ98784.1 hypothetical protein GCM10007863_32040 [Dyella mobilis]